MRILPFAAWAALLLAPLPARAAADTLPALAADTQSLTVSGISSGGYMAVQFQVAHARQVRGAGIVAGGPYDCAQGSVTRALLHCMAPTAAAPTPTTAQTTAAMTTAAAAGRIDPPAALRDDRVWLLSGGGDHTVERPVMDALHDFYRSILPPAAIRYVKLPTAGHAMPSAVDPAANACDTSAPPFINRCPDPDGGGLLDAAGELLAHLLPAPLTAPAPSVPAARRFDQRPFIDGLPADSSLSDTGYIYVPAACTGGGCRVHVAFHGCRQNAGEIGNRFVDGAGYNRWAETNRLIVLYPQTINRYGFAWGSWTWLYNPKGCWDWWGYTGADYAGQAGRQIRAIHQMLRRLAAPLAR